MKKHLLFVCGMAQERSKKAAELFDNNKKYEAKCVGINPFADTRVDSASLAWADYIFVMEQIQKAFLLENFQKDVLGKEIKVLDIKGYTYDDPELERLLRVKLAKEGFL